jgi:arylsulfatase A-like enzyme
MTIRTSVHRAAKPGRKQDGISLLPVAKNPNRVPDRAIELEATSPLFLGQGFPMSYDQPYKGVRTNDYKYIEWSYGATELYDLRTDPYEMHNMIGDPAYAQVKARMVADLAKLNKCAGKSCRIAP